MVIIAQESRNIVTLVLLSSKFNFNFKVRLDEVIRTRFPCRPGLLDFLKNTDFFLKKSEIWTVDTIALNFLTEY